MKAAEIERMLGETPNVVSAYIRKGIIKAERVPSTRAAAGYEYDVTMPIEEIKAILDARIRRARKPATIKAAAKAIALKPLPANKDLFDAEEAARAAGVSKSTVYAFIKETSAATLRNGKSQYVTRDFVEKLREKYRKPEPEPARVLTPLTPATDAKALARLEDKLDLLSGRLDAMTLFLRGFAKAYGYEGAE